MSRDVVKFDIEVHGLIDNSVRTVKKTVSCYTSSAAYSYACELACESGFTFINFIAVCYHKDPESFPVEVL